MEDDQSRRNQVTTEVLEALLGLSTPIREELNTLNAKSDKELSEEILARVEMLARRVPDEKDADAANHIYELTTILTSALSQLEILAPQKFDDLIKNNPSWPINYSITSNLHQKDIEHYRERGLGSLSPVNLNAGYMTPQSEYLRQIIETFINIWKSYNNREIPIGVTVVNKNVIQKISALPRPSKSSLKEWQEAIWEALLLKTKGAPESNSRLREIGGYRRNHSVYIGQQDKATPKTSNSNIRDGIKKALFQKIKTLLK